MTWTFKFKLMNFNEQCFFLMMQQWAVYVCVCLCVWDSVCHGTRCSDCRSGFCVWFSSQCHFGVSVSFCETRKQRGEKTEDRPRRDTSSSSALQHFRSIQPSVRKTLIREGLFFLFSILVILNECNDLWCGIQSIWHCVILSNILTKSICGYIFFFKRPIWL